MKRDFKKREKILLLFANWDIWKVGKILVKPNSQARTSYLALGEAYFSLLSSFKLSVFCNSEGQSQSTLNVLSAGSYTIRGNICIANE